MRPKIFELEPTATYMLTYPEGLQDFIDGVEIQECEGEAVFAFFFLNDRAASLTIDRIEKETRTSFWFSVKNPPIHLVNGVLIVTRTAHTP